MREKLIELLTDNLPRIGALPKCDNPLQYTSDEIVARIADHLITNGITIPIRCKECAYWQKTGSFSGLPYCSLISEEIENNYFLTDSEYFCDSAERKNEDDQTAKVYEGGS